MSRKYIIFLLFLILFITTIASAQVFEVVNDTPIPTFNPTAMATPVITTITTIPPVLEKLSQTFHGGARYADGNPILPGSIITTKDQYGNILTNYTIREIGQYGSSKPYGDKMVVSIFKNQSDRTSRTSIIFVNFFIDDIRARDSSTFKVGEDTEFDILLPIAKPTPITTTTIPTPIPTTIPTPVQTSNVSVQRVITPTPVSPPTSDEIFPGTDNMTLVIYGIVGTVILIFGMFIIVVIQSYLMNKSNRDDSLGPENK